MSLKIKMCPDRRVTEERKALTYGSGDIRFEYFTECLEGKCVAFRDGVCQKYGNKVYFEEQGEQG